MKAGVRLLLYSGGFAPVGGIETFLQGLALALRQKGIAAELLCWGARCALLQEMESAGVAIRRQPWRWGCRWRWPDRLLLPAGKAALRHSDVVLFGKLFDEGIHRKLMGVKAANGGPPFVLVTPYRPAEMWGERRPSDDVLNSFEVMVVQANCFADDLRRFGYRGHVRVLPYLPPSCAEVAPLPPLPPLRIGFLGRLAPQKNLPLLLAAFAAFRRRTEAELHLFGNGAQKDSLQRLAAGLGLSGAVRFHGSVPRRSVFSAIDSCHLFAFTSRTEGQPVAALEILSRGRPVVATAVGVFPELLADPCFGALAPGDGPEAFAAALENVAARAMAGTLRPEDIQATYLARYSRERVLDAYQVFLETLARSQAACR